jgi:hypothetical protein
MFTNVGVAASGGVAAALIIGVSIFPTIVVQWQGHKWRGEERDIAALDHNQVVDDSKV